MIFSCFSDLLFAIELQIRLAACWPISNAGWVMVVNEGDNNDAYCILEKHITFRYSGMLMPSALHAV